MTGAIIWTTATLAGNIQNSMGAFVKTEIRSCFLRYYTGLTEVDLPDLKEAVAVTPYGYLLTLFQLSHLRLVPGGKQELTHPWLIFIGQYNVRGVRFILTNTLHHSGHIKDFVFVVRICYFQASFKRPHYGLELYGNYSWFGRGGNS